MALPDQARLPENMALDRVAITGGTGFLGRHLARRLRDDGADVVVTTRQTPPDSPLDGVRYVPVDWSRGDAVRRAGESCLGARVLFHMAASVDWGTRAGVNGLVSFADHVTQPLLFVDALAKSLEAVVFASSIMVYPIVGTAPFVERRDEGPVNFYGAHKLVFEHAGLRWASETNQHFSAARIAQVYGPGMSVNRFFTDTLAKARTGEPIEVFGDGSATVDWVYVDDVVSGLVLCAQVGQTGVFNIGSGVGTSNLTLAQGIASALGSPSQAAPRPEMHIAARRQVLNLDHARKELGYSPRFPLRDGILATEATRE